MCVLRAFLISARVFVLRVIGVCLCVCIYVLFLCDCTVCLGMCVCAYVSLCRVYVCCASVCVFGCVCVGGWVSYVDVFLST